MVILRLVSISLLPISTQQAVAEGLMDLLYFHLVVGQTGWRSN